MSHIADFFRRTQVWLRLAKPWAELTKPWLELLQAVGTVFALIAGLWWFMAQNYIDPNLKLEQTVTARRIDAKCILWTIDVHATNIGKVGVSLGDDAGALDVYPLIPTESEDKKLDSTKLHATLLQPGESDQVLLETLYLDERYKTIQVNSYYSVPPRRWLKVFSEKPHYWAVRSVADLDLKAVPEKPVAKDKKTKAAKDATVDTTGTSCSEQ